MTNNQNIFNLSPEELNLTLQLQEIIVKEINNNAGVIPFSRYMELALYYPGLGYYSNPLFKFGAKGDFVTAPLVSNLFGYLIANQLNELFSFGVKPQILEFGAGNGKLAVDILEKLGDRLDNYYILELSADLIMRQQQTIQESLPAQAHKVKWLQTLPQKFEGIMLANEVLDAQPCNLVQYQDGQYTNVGVTYDNTSNSFQYKNYYADTETLELAKTLQIPQLNHYLSEISLSSRGFIRSIGDSLTHGAILLIDYGYGQNEYYHPQKSVGTLRGFYRQHVLDSVLIYPGLIDITTSVEWTSIATTAIESGLELIGYSNQANFLINCGLINMLEDLKNNLNETQYLRLSNQVNKLISQNEMGTIFKVCGFSKGVDQDSWIGFSNGDLTYSL